MTHYTEEQIMIRAMPCPRCGAAPRFHCNRKPAKNGLIKNHQARQFLWHDFVKSAAETKQVSVFDRYHHLINGNPRLEHEVLDDYDELT